MFREEFRGLRALRRKVLREFRQEVQRRENPEISLGPGYDLVFILVGKGSISLFLGLVDHLLAVGHLDQPRRLKGQRVMYWIRRLIPCWSPAGRNTDWSTLNPLCCQVRMLSTTSGSILAPASNRSPTAHLCH